MKIIFFLLITAILSLQANENKQQDNVLIVGSYMWQDEPYTYHERQARYDLKNYGKSRNWKSAISYCEKLSFAGYDDWKLPSKNELLSIVDKSRKTTIKKEFKNTLSTFYWSSTPHKSINNEALFVHFQKGISNHTYKSRTHFVRCVREVQ